MADMIQNPLFRVNDIKKEARVVIDELRDIPVWQIIKEDVEWWDNYWKDVPKINLPNPFLQDIVNYGLYKQAISTPEHGIACSLQGPFNEEYQLPPWSNDYHYNINIEMIYLPALATNQAGGNRFIDSLKLELGDKK